MQKLFSVPFVCYVYAKNKTDAYVLYQNECSKNNMLHYTGLSKKQIKKLGKVKRTKGLELVHM